jgi:hypothetical protein
VRCLICAMIRDVIGAAAADLDTKRRWIRHCILHGESKVHREDEL